MSAPARLSDTDVKFLLGNKKLHGYDSDEADMAVRDINAHFSAEKKIPAALQAELWTEMFWGISDHPSNDVKSNCSRFFADCTQYFDDEKQKEIVAKLCDYIAQEEKKTTVQVDPDVLAKRLATKREMGHAVKNIVKRSSNKIRGLVGPGLVTALVTVLERKEEANKREFDLELICLDIIRDVLTHLGTTLPAQDVQRINAKCKQLLKHDNANVRKSAAYTVGPLVTCLGEVEGKEQTFNEFIREILDEASSRTAKFPMTYVQTISVACEFAAARLAGSVSRAISVLLGFCPDDPTSSEASEFNHNMWEECLKGLSTIVSKCPTGVESNQVTTIVNKALVYLQYDPFFNAEVQDQEEEDSSSWGTAGYHVSTEAAARDDSDSTWRIRRASVSILATIIKSRTRSCSALRDLCCHCERLQTPVFRARRLSSCGHFLCRTSAGEGSLCGTYHGE